MGRECWKGPSQLVVGWLVGEGRFLGCFLIADPLLLLLGTTLSLWAFAEISVLPRQGLRRGQALPVAFWKRRIGCDLGKVSMMQYTEIQEERQERMIALIRCLDVVVGGRKSGRMDLTSTSRRLCRPSTTNLLQGKALNLKSQGA